MQSWLARLDLPRLRVDSQSRVAKPGRGSRTHVPNRAPRHTRVAFRPPRWMARLQLRASGRAGGAPHLWVLGEGDVGAQVEVEAVVRLVALQQLNDLLGSQLRAGRGPGGERVLGERNLRCPSVPQKHPPAIRTLWSAPCSVEVGRVHAALAWPPQQASPPCRTCSVYSLATLTTICRFCCMLVSSSTLRHSSAHSAAADGKGGEETQGRVRVTKVLFATQQSAKRPSQQGCWSAVAAAPMFIVKSARNPYTCALPPPAHPPQPTSQHLPGLT